MLTKVGVEMPEFLGEAGGAGGGDAGGDAGSDESGVKDMH